MCPTSHLCPFHFPGAGPHHLTLVIPFCLASLPWLSPHLSPSTTHIPNSSSSHAGLTMLPPILPDPIHSSNFLVAQGSNKIPSNAQVLHDTAPSRSSKLTIFCSLPCTQWRCWPPCCPSHKMLHLLTWNSLPFPGFLQVPSCKKAFLIPLHGQCFPSVDSLQFSLSTQSGLCAVSTTRLGAAAEQGLCLARSRYLIKVPYLELL